MSKVKERKRFFLAKEAKTFISLDTRVSNAYAIGAKVFWFFFSKKNCLPFVFFVSPASAHAFLDGAQPRVGSIIPAPPAEVLLNFTQGVEPDFSKIEVQDQSGASVTAGPAHTAGVQSRFAVPVKKLAPGVYTVIWHATSVDTHKTQGKFHFTVRP
jgi:methionine-rich copper-binding protein CopC